MPTAKTPREMHREVESPAIDANAVLGGVLRRMGDVLGPGASYSLVHYGALEEGLSLTLPSGSDAASAVQTVASILGLRARVDSDRDGIQVQLTSASGFRLEGRASMALVVGLLEGALTTARRRKVQARSEPTLDDEGTLHIDLGG